jgi:uncharacterized protein YndB with AHSA1/START domain
MTTVQTPSPTVRKSVTVAAGVERAFQVFTDGFDTWWPRSHHIGTAPLEKAVIEPGVGGRCYGRSVDGTECPWGRIVVWEPPQRFAFAWQINGQWQYEPDLARASEVEVRFTPLPGGGTRVDLEHRHLERHGADAEAVRTGVDSPGGWGGLLQIFADKVDGR